MPLPSGQAFEVGSGSQCHRNVITLSCDLSPAAPTTTAATASHMRAQSAIDHRCRAPNGSGGESRIDDSYSSDNTGVTVSADSDSPAFSPPYSPPPVASSSATSTAKYRLGSFTRRAALNGYPWGELTSLPRTEKHDDHQALDHVPSCAVTTPFNGHPDPGGGEHYHGERHHTSLPNCHGTETLLEKEPYALKFHLAMNGHTPNGQTSNTYPSEDEHPFFSGIHDVRRKETTTSQRRILSSKGTIRGIKNMVRAGIATFMEQQDQVSLTKKNYRLQEQGRLILYTTSMMIVRDTYDKCKKVRNMLQTHMVLYEERDIFMSRENQRELSERLSFSNVDVPQLFANGQHLGKACGVENKLSVCTE